MNTVTLEVLFIIFFSTIVIDFGTGILVACKNGRLKSRTCSNGMFRSIGECVVLLSFILTSKLIPELNLILSTFMIGFIFKEGISIMENLVGLDVWIPDSLKKMFEVGVDKVNKLENKGE